MAVTRAASQEEEQRAGRSRLRALIWWAHVRQRHAQPSLGHGARLLHHCTPPLLSLHPTCGMPAWPSCTCMWSETWRKMLLKWRSPCASLLPRPRTVSSPFTRLHRNENPEEFWLCLIQTNGCVMSPPPPPGVTRPFFFFLLLCLAGWTLSLRGIMFCLQHPRAASGSRKLVLPQLNPANVFHPPHH